MAKPSTPKPPVFPGDGIKAEPEITLVRMIRDAEVYDYPDSADVHPDEVAHWQEHGWVIAE